MSAATFLLLKDIQKELEIFFESKSFPVPNENNSENNSKKFTAPNIVIGHLPPKKSIKSDKPPFIIVRPWEGTQGKKNGTNADVHEIRIGLVCCVWTDEESSETEAGYNLITNMIDGVLQTLVSKRFWNNNFFTIHKEIEWKVGLTKEQGVYEAGLQDHPFYGAAVTATFESEALKFPRPIGTIDAEEKL